MSFSSIGLLQFDELKQLVARYAGSAAGRDLVLALEPHSDRALLETDLADAGEAIGYLEDPTSTQDGSRGGAVRLHFDQLRDIDNSVRILKVEGASLDGKAILDLFHTLSLAGEYRAILTSVAERYPRLARLGTRLADLRSVAKRYASAFLPDGSLADSASVALGRIRRDIVK